jgi:hypothetical protein
MLPVAPQRVIVAGSSFAGLTRRALAQRALARTGAWSLVAGGCHPARDTLAAIEDAGFAIARHRRLTVAP